MSHPSAIRSCPRCGIRRESNGPCKDCKNVKPPRPAPYRVEQLAGYSIKRAGEFACLVRDESRDGIGDYLDRLNQQQLYGLVVALAAMVPIDQTSEDLLAWVRELDGLSVAAMVPEVAA